MTRAFAVFSLLALPHAALAQRAPLTPQNRLHAGASLTQMDAFGVTGGIDSRLTAIISIDAAAFVSPAEPEATEPAEGEDPADSIHLRHGLLFSPGLRIPHRYGPEVNWDFVGRIGFASVWSNDTANPRDTLQADPAMMGGVDFLVRRKSLGLRGSAREFFFKPFSAVAREELIVLRPQVAVEALYQW